MNCAGMAFCYADLARFSCLAKMSAFTKSFTIAQRAAARPAALKTVRLQGSTLR